MNHKQYWMARDCPECGLKDEVDAWLGARMSSTAWGHPYACCSDKCGFAFKNSPKRIEMDRAALREKQAMLKAAIRQLEQEEAALRPSECQK